MALWLLPKRRFLCVGAKANVPLCGGKKMNKKCAVGKRKNTQGSAKSVGLPVVPFQYGLFLFVCLSKWFTFLVRPSVTVRLHGRLLRLLLTAGVQAFFGSDRDASLARNGLAKGEQPSPNHEARKCLNTVLAVVFYSSYTSQFPNILPCKLLKINRRGAPLEIKSLINPFIIRRVCRIC